MTEVSSGILNSPFIGVSNFHIAKLESDPAGGKAVYGDSLAFPWLKQVQIKPSKAQETLYADNMAVESAATLPYYDLTIDTATLPLEYKALLLGHVYENGVLTVTKEDTPPYFAVMFESTKANGKRRFVRFVKVQFTEPDENSQTKEDKITYNTPQMTAKAIYRTSDNVALQQADEEADGYVETVGKNWYTMGDTSAAGGTSK